MKKITFLLSFVVCAIFANAAEVETVYLETCGTQDVATSGPNYRPKVDLYTGWDKTAPITYTRTTSLDGYADVRITSTTTNNVWFPAAKNSDLIISNIPAAGYNNLKLSFDVATYSTSGTNADKVNVYCNGTLLTVPSAAITGSNIFQSIGSINLQSADVINLKFEYTAVNNPVNIGYRLDNFKITGEKTTGLSTTNESKLELIVSGKNLLVKNVTDGSEVEIFSAVGSKVLNAVVENGKVNIANLKGGMYVVRSGKLTQKIRL